MTGRTRRAPWLLAAIPAVVCCCLAGMLSLATAIFFGHDHSVPPAVACPVPVSSHSAAQLASLDDEQWANAEVVVAVGVDLGAPTRAWVIAIATALQESGLRNLPHLGQRNDHDSLGLFQQRPSQGWGSAEQIMDPVYAATAFYQRLLAVPGWDELALTEAAQAVQRSAYPHAYARHEPLAATIVTTVAGSGEFGADCGYAQPVGPAGWVAPAVGPVWSGFRTAHRPEHYGVDIGAPRGAPVHAAADGTVTLVACNAFRHGAPYSCDVDGSPEVTGCGWYVEIRHVDGVVTRYCHLLRHPPVEVGQQVAGGQPIGLVGSSGHSSGPHLHFEVELQQRYATATGWAWQRRQTDPVPFLAARGVALHCAGATADCIPVHGDRVRVS